MDFKAAVCKVLEWVEPEMVVALKKICYHCCNVMLFLSITSFLYSVEIHSVCG